MQHSQMPMVGPMMMVAQQQQQNHGGQLQLPMLLPPAPIPRPSMRLPHPQLVQNLPGFQFGINFCFQQIPAQTMPTMPGPLFCPSGPLFPQQQLSLVAPGFSENIAALPTSVLANTPPKMLQQKYQEFLLLLQQMGRNMLMGMGMARQQQQQLNMLQLLQMQQAVFQLQQHQQAAPPQKPPRNPLCALCFVHGVESALRGHRKPLCPFDKCGCTKCVVIQDRRQQKAKEARIQRGPKKAFENGQPSNGNDA